MHKKRVIKAPQERRQELIDAARQLFVQRGYEETSVSDIVKKIGVTQGTFYWHFPSKQEILAAIMREMAELITAVMRKTAERQELAAIEKLRQMENESMALMTEHSTLLQALWIRANAPFREQLIKETNPQFLLIIVSIIRQGVAEGVFHVSNPEAAAVFVLAVVDKFFDEVAREWSIQKLTGAEPASLNPNSGLLPATVALASLREARWEFLLGGLGARGS